MTKLLSILAISLALGVLGCGVSPTGGGERAVSTVAMPAEPAAPTALTPDGPADEALLSSCPQGEHTSCYRATGDCGCCPLNEILDCFGPGDCICCHGISCP